MVTVIVTDLDNTLFEMDVESPPEQFFEKIKDWRKNDREWVVATGRSPEQTEEFISSWPEKPSHFIARERYIYRVDAEETVPWAEWNQRLREKTEKIETERDIWLPRIEDWLAREKFEAELTESYLQFESEAGARQAEQKLANILPDDRKTIRNRFYLGVVPEETGKGRCLKQLANHQGWTAEEIVCVGDSANDLDMLDGRYGFRSAAVANAEPRIKEVVADNDGILLDASLGQGVVELLDRCCRASG